MEFDTRLDQYAELMVRVGMNVQPGQRVFVRATRSEPEFVYRVARSAYRAGASLVHVVWEEDMLELIRIQEAAREALDQVPEWYALAYNSAAEHDDAFLLMHVLDPEQFQGIDLERATAVRNARSTAIRPMLLAQAHNTFQWSVCRVPNTVWANRMFPNEPSAVQVQKQWDAIFATARIGLEDPVAAWRKHIADLVKRSQALTAKQYRALHFKSSVTDLTLGLPRGHIWFGGDSLSRKGVHFTANIPTEEVFTLPHREQADGYVTMTRPFSFNGVLIHNFTLTFENGKVTGISASNGLDALESLVNTDEGASHLGEVALVPASNPIAKMNLVFYDGLYDENAASHIAMGRAYRFNLQDSAQMSDAEFRAAGGNDSMIHEDTMIGSPDMNVDGIREDGTSEPVMRDGEWAFAVT